MTKEKLKELVKKTMAEVTMVDKQTTPDEATTIAKQEKKDLPTVKKAIDMAKKTGQSVSIAETEGKQKYLVYYQIGSVGASRTETITANDEKDAKQQIINKVGGIHNITKGWDGKPIIDIKPTPPRTTYIIPENNTLQKSIINTAKEKKIKSEAVAYFPDEKGEFERVNTGDKDPTQVGLDRLLQKFKNQDLDEDLDIGHQDDEVGMLISDLYRIEKYAGELCDIVKELGRLDGEVDFPHWWQAKIIKAKDNMVSAKHYIDGGLKTGQAFNQ